MVIFFLAVVFQVVNGQLSCQGWTRPLAGNNSKCVCGNSIHELIICDNDTLQLSVKNCIIITSNSTQVLAAQTPHTCYNFLLNNGTLKARDSVAFFNRLFCSLHHRRGLLCGQCEPEYGVPMYSYSLTCIKCANNKWIAWAKYIAVAYLPLTLFFITIALFRISASSGPLNSFIMASQILSSPQLLRYVVNSNVNIFNKHLERFLGCLLTFFSAWNLDFFRLIYQPFCIEPSWTALDVIVLEYMIAVYPQVLLLVTYGIIKMHDRYPCIVWICTPIRKCSSKLIPNWNIKNSMVGYFSTFMILSYLKILNTSIDLLTSTDIYAVNGSIARTVSYYDSSLTVFRGAHLPYGILAIFMLLVFNVCPFLLLLCYPNLLFQKLLNAIKCNSHFMHILMDSLHGCYLHDKYDFRYMAAVNVALRLLNVIILLKLLDNIYFTVMAMLLICYAVAIAVIKPYKKPSNEYLSISALLALSYSYLMLPLSNHFNSTIYPALLFTSCLLLQGTATLIFIVCPNKVWMLSRKMINIIYTKLRRRPHHLEDSLPYRMQNSEEKSLVNVL